MTCMCARPCHTAPSNTQFLVQTYPLSHLKLTKPASYNLFG